MYGTTLAFLLATLPAAAPATAGREGQGRWIRIQYAGRITPADRAGLARLGLSAIQYMPEDAYVAFAHSPGAEKAVRGLPRVDGVGALTPPEKLDPSLLRPSAPVLADVVVFGPSAAAAASRLGALGRALNRDSHQVGGELASLLMELAPPTLLRAAEDPAVLWIGPAATGIYPEDEASAQIQAGNISDGLPVLGYEGWLSEHGIDGEGVIVSIADTGIDASHPEHRGRVVKEIFYDGPHSNDEYGHGTHVAGIVGGSGATLSDNARARDFDGFLAGIGVAPKVSYINQVVIPRGSHVGSPIELATYTADAVRAGAIAWNASWTTGGPNGGYVKEARLLDMLARDGDRTAPGNQAFMMVFSAGNAGPNPNTITQPHEAKNIITVGSTQSHRVINGSIEAPSSFSSRGPTKDGRIAPTVSAPGESILSSASSDLSAALLGSCARPGLAGAETFVLAERRYVACSGTSMAAPHVTGAVALIVDRWRAAHDGADPSPAMAKALLVNTATDIGPADVPNGAEGWGRVNLAGLFDPVTQWVTIDQSVVLTGVGDAHPLDVEAVDPTKPIRFTIAWTDAPGAPGAPKALVNDLDLRVIAPNGNIYLGNEFSQGRSMTGGAADRRNNVENVWLGEAGEGTFHVEVSAANLPGDGIPNFGVPTDQDFALVISNAVEVVTVP